MQHLLQNHIYTLKCILLLSRYYTNLQNIVYTKIAQIFKIIKQDLTRSQNTAFYVGLETNEDMQCH